MHAYRVVAAIDYGTHGSGFAWTVVDPRWRTKSDREIYDFDGWPDEPRNQRYPKTLSAMLSRHGELAAWGHTAFVRLNELPPGAARDGAGDQGYRFFAGLKMSLRPPDDPNRPLPGGSALTDRLPDPVPVIAMYLRELRAKAISEITRTGEYDPDDIRWCLTVPAIWNQKSLDAMRRAAVQAGLPGDRERLLLVPEPDAAALYCDVMGSRATASFAETGRGLLHPGMRFLVIDCGGGTVDLVSYEVTEDGKLDQLIRPGGGPYGAEYVTQAFLYEALGKRFGSGLDLEALQRQNPRQFALMAAQWEGQRNTFSADTDLPVLIDIAQRLRREIPAHAVDRLRDFQGGVDDQIVLPPEEVRELLDGAIDPTLRHVDDQLAGWQRPPGAGDLVFLVGGFANSPYLQERVLDHLRDRLPVRVAARPERAVLFGAVHYCYDPTMLRARRARYTYGCAVAMAREPGDRDDYRLYSEDGDEYTDHRFSVFVAINEKVPVDREVRHRLYPFRSTSREVALTFYSTMDERPRYVTDARTRKEITMTVSLSGSMHLPRDERAVDVYLKFGEAQIQARAVNVATGAEVERTFTFEGDY